VVGYFPAWGVYGRDFHVPDIQAEHLTHVLYAFASVTVAGQCVLGDPYADIDKLYPGDTWDAGALRGSFHQLQILKAQHPHLRTILSVGGWTWSGNFSAAASTGAGRTELAATCVQMLLDYEFDGLSIDWEYPVAGGLGSNTTSPDDRANHALLMQELRGQLDAAEATTGNVYELSMASSANPTLAANLDLAALNGVVDWFDLMSYDYRGSWDSTTGLQSPLYAVPGDPLGGAADLNVHAAVTAYLAAGVTPSKLVVGAPFYGRAWAGVPDVNDGLFASFSGLPAGTWETGVYDYADLAANWISPAVEHWEPTAQVPWLYDPTQQVMVTYDNPASLATKAQYVIDQGLGGMMVWELSADTAANDLLSSITGVLGMPSP